MIVHAYRLAVYASEPTNAEAPVWAACRLPTQYPEKGVFRITVDSIYLLPTYACPKGVPGQGPHLWAFVAQTPSSIGVSCSVVLLGVCGSWSSSMYVCVSVASLLAFWDNVLFYGRRWLRRPLLWGFLLLNPRQRYRFQINTSLEGVSGQPPHIWAFASPSSSFVGICASAHCGRLRLLFATVSGLYVFGFGK